MFTWGTGAAQKTSAFLQRSREGAPSPLVSICRDRHIANGGASHFPEQDAGREFQNRPWLVNRCQGSGRNLCGISASDPSHVPIHNPTSRRASPTDYSSRDLDGSHQGMEVGTAFQKEASESCSKNHKGLPEIRPQPLITQTKGNFLYLPGNSPKAKFTKRN